MAQIRGGSGGSTPDKNGGRNGSEFDGVNPDGSTDASRDYSKGYGSWDFSGIDSKGSTDRARNFTKGYGDWDFGGVDGWGKPGSGKREYTEPQLQDLYNLMAEWKDQYPEEGKREEPDWKDDLRKRAQMPSDRSKPNSKSPRGARAPGVLGLMLLLMEALGSDKEGFQHNKE